MTQQRSKSGAGHVPGESGGPGRPGTAGAADEWDTDAAEAVRLIARQVDDLVQARTAEAVRSAERAIASQIARACDGSLTARLTDLAREFSHLRKLGNLPFISSTDGERNADWFLAKTFVVLKLIEHGELNIAQIDPSSYHLFDGVWLDCLHRLKAYYVWRNEGHGSVGENYFVACREIRRRLLDPESAARDKFDRVAEYISDVLLRADGRLNDQSDVVKGIVRAKAHRLWELTGVADEGQNWHLARLHAAMFYENVVPAVMLDDPQATTAVLRSLQFAKSPATPYRIINAFETVVAIEFLNKKLVRQLIAAPAVCSFAIAPAPDWPADYALPHALDHGQLRFDGASRQVTYCGVMGEGEWSVLRKQLVTELQRRAVDELYAQSGMRPLEVMVL